MSQYKSNYTGPQIDEAVGKALNIEAINNLTNYYLKNEIYTKTEVQNLINNISTLNIEVVASLPATGDTTTIYLVPNTSSGNNVYDEYLYANNKWEIIGSTQIDLSGYAKKTEIPTKVSQLENDSGFITGYTETDPTVPSHVKAITSTDISNWNNKQAPLTAGENITIENGVISASGGGGGETRTLIASQTTSRQTITLPSEYDKIEIIFDNSYWYRLSMVAERVWGTSCFVTAGVNTDDPVTWTAINGDEVSLLRGNSCSRDDADYGIIGKIEIDMKLKSIDVCVRGNSNRGDVLGTYIEKMTFKSLTSITLPENDKEDKSGNWEMYGINYAS